MLITWLGEVEDIYNLQSSCTPLPHGTTSFPYLLGHAPITINRPLPSSLDVGSASPGDVSGRSGTFVSDSNKVVIRKGLGMKMWRSEATCEP
jgi:hypothetical protein